MPSYFHRFCSWFKPYIFPCIYFLITFLTIALPAIAQTSSSLADCNNINIPDSWKSHFPFDLVYPVGAPYQSDNSCPTITFWGTDRQVCTIPQVTAVIKNVFLAKVAITGLLEL